MPKLLIAATLVVVLGAFIVRHWDPKVPQPSTTLVGDNELISLTSATGWLNTPPLTAKALRAKVVLVQVWTFSCINWLRTPSTGAATSRPREEPALFVSELRAAFRSLRSTQGAAR